MNRILLVMSFSCIALYSSFVSAGSKVDPSSLERVNTPKADIMPTKQEITGAKVKLVIFNPSDQGIDLAKSASLGHSIGTTLEQIAVATGAVEIIDRNLAQQLQKEIQLSELKGLQEYEGPNIADYAITGTVSGASIGSRFTERSYWTDDEGKKHVNPARCHYSAKVAANLRIYKLPALNFSTGLSIKGTERSSSDTRSSNCPFNNKSAAGLAREAAISAVKKSRTNLENYFAVKGYVLEHRKNKKRHYFKINRGSSMGFKAKAKVIFYGLENYENPLSDEISVEEKEVSKGKVYGKPGEKYSWIEVKKKDAGKIKIGDYVKIPSKKTFCEKIGLC